MDRLMSLPPSDTILFQGDSITDAVRRREDQALPNNSVALGTGYAALVASSLLADHPAKNLQIFNRGISGNRIVDLYARIREDVLNLKPHLLSVLIGVNDTWHHFNRNAGVSVDKFTRIYHSFLQEIRSEIHAFQFVLCEPLLLKCGVAKDPWLAEFDERRVAVRQLAAEFNATFIPFHEILTDATKLAPPEYWADDGVHPTAAGHALMASRLA